jgi:membrane-associated phospholipid phosphatase
MTALPSATARSVGAVEFVERVLPGWGAGLMALLTQLGDFWFLCVLLGLCYWQFPAERVDVAGVSVTALGGLGRYRTLKHTFEAPRPATVPVDPADVPGLLRPLYENAIAVGGFGFPSGHATTATLLYVGLAVALPVGTRRQRFVAAAVLVATVCLTRVALSVHALVDVIGGIPTGLAALALFYWLPTRDRTAPAADRR